MQYIYFQLGKGYSVHCPTPCRDFLEAQCTRGEARQFFHFNQEQLACAFCVKASIIFYRAILKHHYND
jgi:hypothetical protein